MLVVAVASVPTPIVVLVVTPICALARLFVPVVTAPTVVIVVVPPAPGTFVSIVPTSRIVYPSWSSSP